MKIWNKSEETQNNLLAEAYTVGNDNIIDMNIIKYDIQASLAHAAGLVEIKILTPEEYSSIETAMQKLLGIIDAGNFIITKEDEDCHTAIENFLITELGDLGKKIHTGRSRNDQVLVAIRLYMADHAKTILKSGKIVEKSFLDLAKKHQKLPFPGYSHTQQAMITTLGHYFASFYESIADDLVFLEMASDHVNQNPLGSAAGLGVNLPLSRDLTTKLLKFRKTQVNSLYCQNSRGKFESIYIETLAQIMMTFGKFAEDMIMFTTREFAFFSVEDTFTTGSSIMPQKKNLDVMELLRANVSLVISEQLNIKMLAKSLPSGYNRDFQLMKQSLFNAVSITEKSIEIVAAFLQAITPNEESILSKIKTDIIAADLATEKAKNGMPFRDAYKIVMDEIDKTPIDWNLEISRRQSLGSSGNLGLPKTNV